MSANTVIVRTSTYADSQIEAKIEKANRQRAKQKKAPLSKSKAYEAAVKSLTVKDLVES